MLWIVDCMTTLDPHNREATLILWGWSTKEGKDTEVGHVFDLVVNTFEGIREGFNLSVSHVILESKIGKEQGWLTLHDISSSSPTPTHSHSQESHPTAIHSG